jgi:hypothetical protein
MSTGTSHSLVPERPAQKLFTAEGAKHAEDLADQIHKTLRTLRLSGEKLLDSTPSAARGSWTATDRRRTTRANHIEPNDTAQKLFTAEDAEHAEIMRIRLKETPRTLRPLR